MISVCSMNQYLQWFPASQHAQQFLLSKHVVTININVRSVSGSTVLYPSVACLAFVRYGYTSASVRGSYSNAIMYQEGRSYKNSDCNGFADRYVYSGFAVHLQLRIAKQIVRYE